MNALHQALVKFHNLKIELPQDKENPFFTSKYTSLKCVQDTIIDTVAEHDLGLSFLTYAKKDELGSFIEVVVMHRESEDVIAHRVPLIMKDQSDPQKMGSSITYARRYGLCLAFGLVDQASDDDGNAGADKQPSGDQKGKWSRGNG